MANKLLQDIINEINYTFPYRYSYISDKEKVRRKKAKRVTIISKRKNR